MDFFINQHATSPILVLKVINDGRNDFNALHEGLENSCITFAMKNIETGKLKVAHKTGGYIIKPTIHPDSPKEYYIFYRWAAKDTDTVGQYQGQFWIKLLDTYEDLIVPIRDDLFITVRGSFVKSKSITC